MGRTRRRVGALGAEQCRFLRYRSSHIYLAEVDRVAGDFAPPQKITLAAALNLYGAARARVLVRMEARAALSRTEADHVRNSAGPWGRGYQCKRMRLTLVQMVFIRG